MGVGLVLGVKILSRKKNTCSPVHVCLYLSKGQDRKGRRICDVTNSLTIPRGTLNKSAPRGLVSCFQGCLLLVFMTE